MFWIRIAALAFALSYIFEAFPDFCGLLLIYICIFKTGSRGVYIGKYPTPLGGNYQLMSFGGKKNEKANRKKGKM